MKPKIDIDNLHTAINPLCQKLAVMAIDYVQDLKDTLDVPRSVEKTILIGGLVKALGGTIGQNIRPEHTDAVVEDTAKMLKEFAESYHEFEERLKK